MSGKHQKCQRDLGFHKYFVEQLKSMQLLDGMGTPPINDIVDLHDDRGPAPEQSLPTLISTRHTSAAQAFRIVIVCFEIPVFEHFALEPLWLCERRPEIARC